MGDIKRLLSIICIALLSAGFSYASLMSQNIGDPVMPGVAGKAVDLFPAGALRRPGNNYLSGKRWVFTTHGLATTAVESNGKAFVLQNFDEPAGVRVIAVDGAEYSAVLDNQDIVLVKHNPDPDVVLITENDYEQRIDLIRFGEAESDSEEYSLSVDMTGKQNLPSWLMTLSREYAIDRIYALMDAVAGLFVQLVAPEKYQMQLHYSGERTTTAAVCAFDQYPCQPFQEGPTGVHKKNWEEALGIFACDGRQCPPKNPGGGTKGKARKTPSRENSPAAKDSYQGLTLFDLARAVEIVEALDEDSEVIHSPENQGQRPFQPIKNGPGVDPLFVSMFNHLLDRLAESSFSPEDYLNLKKPYLNDIYSALIYMRTRGEHEQSPLVKELVSFLKINNLTCLWANAKNQAAGFRHYSKLAEKYFIPPPAENGTLTMPFQRSTMESDIIPLIEQVLARLRAVGAQSEFNADPFAESVIVFMLKVIFSHDSRYTPEQQRIALWLDHHPLAAGWRNWITNGVVLEAVTSGEPEMSPGPQVPVTQTSLTSLPDYTATASDTPNPGSANYPPLPGYTATATGPLSPVPANYPPLPGYTATATGPLSPVPANYPPLPGYTATATGPLSPAPANYPPLPGYTATATGPLNPVPANYPPLPGYTATATAPLNPGSGENPPQPSGGSAAAPVQSGVTPSSSLSALLLVPAHSYSSGAGPGLPGQSPGHQYFYAQSTHFRNIPVMPACAVEQGAYGTRWAAYPEMIPGGVMANQPPLYTQSTAVNSGGTRWPQPTADPKYLCCAWARKGLS